MPPDALQDKNQGRLSHFERAENRNKVHRLYEVPRTNKKKKKKKTGTEVEQSKMRTGKRTSPALLTFLV